MKAGWKEGQLGDLCEMYQPKTITKNEMSPDGAYPVFGANGIMGRYHAFNHDTPQLLIGCRGACGTVHITETKSWVTGNSMVVRPRGPNLSLEFMKYFFLGPAKIEDTITGAAQPQITQGSLRPIKVPLPPLEEQQQIVAVLDEAFAGLARARAHAEANLRDARELFASALAVSFGGDTSDWEEYDLNDLGTIQTGSTPPTAEEGMSGDFVPFVKPGDFLPDGSLRYDNNGLSQKGASVSRLIKAGSALMVCIGATIGKAGFTDRQITTNQQINSVTPKEGVSGEYLYYQMLTPEFQASVIHRSGQATLPIINKSKWSSLRVKLPKQRSKQIEIVEKLALIRSQVDGLLACYQAKLAQIDALRQSLLQKAFAGELT